MLVIRFLRVGKKNQPSFQIVVVERGRAPRAGRFVEKVGFYSPLTKDKKIDADRVKHWLSVGAKPSDTVWNLLVSEKIVEGKKIPVHAKTASKEGAGSPAHVDSASVATSAKEEATAGEAKAVEQKEVQTTPAEQKPEEVKDETEEKPAEGEQK